MMSLLGLPKADTKSGAKAGSICPTMVSLLGLPKADAKSGSKAGSKDEMAAILGHVQ